MNSVRSDNLSLKYKKYGPSGCKVLEIRKFHVGIKNSIPFWTNIQFMKIRNSW